MKNHDKKANLKSSPKKININEENPINESDFTFNNNLQQNKNNPLSSDTTTGNSLQQIDNLINRISSEFDSLSRQLQGIARYIDHRRSQLGLQSIREVANECGVAPSAVIRFAKHFGYSGYSQMQEIFRNNLVTRIAPSMDYHERVRRIIKVEGNNKSVDNITEEYMHSVIGGINEMYRDLPREQIAKAVDLLKYAEKVWIIGARRAFPISLYLNYAFLQIQKPVQLFDGLGFIQNLQIKNLNKNDVVIAISFYTYAKETIDAVKTAYKTKAKIIAITDSPISPIVKNADVSLEVKESSCFGFRSPINALAIAQALFIAYAFKHETN